MEQEPWITFLTTLYSTPGQAAAFSSAEKLYRVLRENGYKVTLAKVKEWLRKQYTYTVHRQRKVTFPRNPTLATHIDHTWQADLLFLQDIASFNDRKPCALVCIDVVSRYAWVAAMRDKRGITTTKAFESVIAQGRKPEKLHTDRGKEFYNTD